MKKQQTKIPENDLTDYPVEICIWNYLYNPQYLHVRDIHLHIWKVENWKILHLKKWVNAFERYLLNMGITSMPMNGKNGFTNYIRHWLPKVGQYKNLNPDILYTLDNIKIGGIKPDAAKALFNRKNKQPTILQEILGELKKINLHLSQKA